MLLPDILFASSRRFARYPALTMRMGYRTLTLTYKDVEELSVKAALFLASQGLQKGDAVIICASNSPYWVCIWWACVLQGYHVVPLAVQSSSSLIEKIILQTQAKLLFISEHDSRAFASLPSYTVERLPDLTAGFRYQHFQLPSLETDNVAEIMYTSGTTGDPKGVVLTHRNIMSNVLALQQAFPIQGTKERLLSILPLSHMFEQTIGFLLPFSIGAHIIYAHSHGAIKDLLKKYCITKMIAVPEFLKLMSQRLQAGMQERLVGRIMLRIHALSQVISINWLQRLLMFPVRLQLGHCLNTIATGGAALDPELERWWNGMGVCIVQGYGLTETAPVITLNTFQERQIGSVGKALPGTHMRLGAQGEIEVSGPNVFSAYFHNPEKTKESFTSDGWFKTDDMGYCDNDGFLFLKGRKKYMIKGPGAQNIFPEDIEAVLNAVTGVKDSCVLGVEHASGMVEIHAVLLLAETATASDPQKIIDEANQRLESYQHITGWSVWTETDFPRSVTQKVKKEEIRAWLKKRHGQISVTKSLAQVSPLMQLLAEISGVSVHQIHPTTSLVYDLKFDSLMRVELITRIEEMRGVLIDERLITSKTTEADLEVIIATAMPLTKMPHVKRWPRWLLSRMIRGFGQMLMWPLSRIFFIINIEGLENLNGIKAPVIFMPNHVSLIDPLIVSVALPRAFRRRLSFAAAYDVLYQEYSYVRWLAELFFNAFPFPRREQEHVTTGLLNIGTMLDAGYSVVVFPEGQVSKDGRLQPLKRGAGLVAVEMGCAVVPVSLKGIEKLVPSDCFFPRKRGVVTITFGKPLVLKKTDSYDNAVSEIYKELGAL